MDLYELFAVSAALQNKKCVALETRRYKHLMRRSADYALRIQSRSVVRTRRNVVRSMNGPGSAVPNRVFMKKFSLTLRNSEKLGALARHLTGHTYRHTYFDYRRPC